MQKFRRGVPENSSVYVCKNSLMKEAVKTVPGWELLADKGCTVRGGQCCTVQS
jgi:ribosomal protein L10